MLSAHPQLFSCGKLEIGGFIGFPFQCKNLLANLESNFIQPKFNTFFQIKARKLKLLINFILFFSASEM